MVAHYDAFGRSVTQIFHIVIQHEDTGSESVAEVVKIHQPCSTQCRHVSTPEDLRTQASLNFRSCMENFVCSMVITSDQADPVAVDLDNTRFCPGLTGPA